MTLWTVACQAPPSMGFSRQEYWSGWPSSSPEDLPNAGIKPVSLALAVDSLKLSHQGDDDEDERDKDENKEENE